MLRKESRDSSDAILLKLLVVLWLVVLSIPAARAVPSYSRQTGLACAPATTLLRN